MVNCVPNVHEKSLPACQMFFIPKLKPHPTFSAEENDQVFIFNPESIEV